MTDYLDVLNIAEKVFRQTGTIARIKGDRAEHLITNENIILISKLTHVPAEIVVKDLKERMK